MRFVEVLESRRLLSITVTPIANSTDRGTFLLGDINGDGVVNFTDQLILAQNYGEPGTQLTGDLNGDGTVNFTDLLILAQNYGHSVQPLVWRISRDGDLSQPQTVDWATSGVDPSELSSSSGIAIIPAGQASVQVQVRPTNLDWQEPDPTTPVDLAAWSPTDPATMADGFDLLTTNPTTGIMWFQQNPAGKYYRTQSAILSTSLTRGLRTVNIMFRVPGVPATWYTAVSSNTNIALVSQSNGATDNLGRGFLTVWATGIPGQCNATVNIATIGQFDLLINVAGF